jgi:hypothetical protein
MISGDYRSLERAKTRFQSNLSLCLHLVGNRHSQKNLPGPIRVRYWILGPYPCCSFSRMPVSASRSAALLTFSKADCYPKINTPMGGNWRVLMIGHPFCRDIKVERRQTRMNHHSTHSET